MSEKKKGPETKMTVMTVDTNDIDVTNDEAILKNDKCVGYVTSGGYAHHVKKSIAIGYIPVELANHGENLNIEINAEEKWVSVQPGIVLDELNQLIYNTGLMFAPDPSTSNRSNVGGALGNNSCGAHSLVWGKTVDNVQDISGVLSNGDQKHSSFFFFAYLNILLCQLKGV